MEKLLIICEKATAAENFSKALGGYDGVFEGDEFHIMHLSGHLFKLDLPKKVALSEYSEYIGDFNVVDSAPWKFNYFDFHKYSMADGVKQTKAINAVKEFNDYVKKGYIPVIATDLDSYCEGDLIGYMLLKFCQYQGKIYREFHNNEGVESIRKAIKERFLVTYIYKNFLVGRARQMSDYLTQCMTRVATDKIRKQGYDVRAPIPVGRLKSADLNLVGDQWLSRLNYKPSSLFEYRYKLDGLVLSTDELDRFNSIEELKNSGIDIPTEASVTKVKETFGTTPPSKLLTMDTLVAKFSKKIPIKTVRNTLQKLYEDGIVSYPRTDEDVISREDFYESLPKVDIYIKSLGLNVDVFTHRTERKTHVVESVTHGGLKPGYKLIKSLDELDQYGDLGKEIYRLITYEFLKMFLEDTEWIRYDYETVDVTPVFKGSVRIITKQGVVNEDDENENSSNDVVSVLPNINNKAVRYEHESKSVKPAKPTISWLLKQLKKYDVGTPATRVSTLELLIGGDDKPFKLDKNELTLTKIGLLGYEISKVIILGSVDGTKKLHDWLKSLRDGKLSLEDLQVNFEELLSSDIESIRSALFSLEKYGFTRDKVDIVWNGQSITINKTNMSYTYTDEDIRKLSNGEEITYMIKDKFDRDFKVIDKIGHGISKTTGREYIGVLHEYVNMSKVTGMWKGQEVSIGRKHGEHEFTNDELKCLFNGEEIEITVKGVKLIGKLGPKDFKGTKHIGFVAEPKGSTVNVVKGVWKGEEVKFSKRWSTYEFSEKEISDLLEGKIIKITYKDKNGKTRTTSGKLQHYEYNGKQCFGFKSTSM